MLLVERIRAFVTAVFSTNRCSDLGDAALAAPGFSRSFVFLFCFGVGGVVAVAALLRCDRGEDGRWSFCGRSYDGFAESAFPWLCSSAGPAISLPYIRRSESSP